MADLTRAEIAAKITEYILDNTLRKITPAQLREVLGDINDSTFNEVSEIAHNELGGLNGGDYQHFTDAQKVNILALIASYASDLSELVPYIGATQDLVMPLMTNIRLLNVTPSQLLYIDASNNILSLSTSTYPNLTELSRIKGLVSPVQNQLNAKVNLNTLITAGSGNTFTVDEKGLITGYSTVSQGSPQANKIYVDSVNGVNSTGRGDINTPYLTPEFAMSDITNTGTVSATTTSGSATLTAVSSTANIVKGQFITGAGIPYNSVVIDKTSNTIVLSQTCTASATITATWWTVYILYLNGNFTATATWLKECFYFARNESVTVSWGAFIMWNITTIFKTPYFNDCTFNFYGTTSTSYFYRNTTVVNSNDIEFTLNFQNVISVTTGTLCVQGSSPYFGGKYYVNAKSFVAKFGYVFSQGWLDSGSVNIWNIDYSYGLLGGIYISDYCSWVCQWNGSRIETPSSVYAVYGSQTGARWHVNVGRILGSVYYFGSEMKADIDGTTNIFTNTRLYGSLSAGGEFRGGCKLYGLSPGYLYVTAGYNTIEGTSVLGNGPLVQGSATLEINAEQLNLYQLRTENSSTLVLNAKCTVTSSAVNVYAGTTLVVNAKLIPSAGISCSGTIDVNGEIEMVGGSIVQNTGSVINCRGRLTSLIATTTVPLIQKDAGTLNLYPNSKFKVANAKPPIKCTANTSASKDIYMFNAISNGNGSTYGLFFAFDGSSFVPNDLVGGVLYENTTF